MGYFDTNNNPQVSYRQATGYTEPQPVTGATLVANSSGRVISFSRSAAAPFAGAVAVSGTNIPIIWGYSSRKPTANGRISRHDFFGTLTYNLESQTQTAAAASTDSTQLILWHGGLMLVAWLLFPAIAVFVARFLKSTLGHTWFRIHSGLFLLTGIIGIVAIVLVAVARGNVLYNPHAVSLLF